VTPPLRCRRRTPFRIPFSKGCADSSDDESIRPHGEIRHARFRRLPTGLELASRGSQQRERLIAQSLHLMKELKNWAIPLPIFSNAVFGFGLYALLRML